jgi:hypothetical protein
MIFLTLAVQVAEMPIPAEPPIGGPIWAWVVPALLLLVAFGSTWLLYRRFSSKGSDGDGS